MRQLLQFFALACFCFCAAHPTCAQQHHHGAEAVPSEVLKKVGTVHFPTSCSATAQVSFEHGVAMLHSFWYEEAKKQFAAAAEQDPHCAMADWGLAMTEWHTIWDGLPEYRLKEAVMDIDKAITLGAGTEREQRYLAAMGAFVHAQPTKNPQALKTYTAAMDGLRSRYPQDAEAQAFDGLAWVALELHNHDPSGMMDDARKALAILQPGFSAYPNHPGFAHYIIHACDNPQLAREGLPAAEAYAAIAPASPHAAHMPSHIFARLGMWPQDIDSNWDSVRAAEMAVKQNLNGALYGLHSYVFLMYAYLQDGNDAGTKKVQTGADVLMTEVAQTPGAPPDNAYDVAYFRYELPSINFLERRQWSDALSLSAPSSASAEREYADSWYAYDWTQAIAGGHLRNAEAADRAVENIQSLYVSLKQDPASMSPKKRAQLLTMQGWQSYAHHRDAEALEKLSAAADVQDKVGQAEVDIPAREMYADMLLAADQPQQALVHYKRALQLSPNRFNALAGAAQAAERAGHADEARAFYMQLLQVTDGGRTSSRPEIAKARTFLGPAPLSRTVQRR